MLGGVRRPRAEVQAVARSAQPGDKVVFVGDCAETRLYKDGIGAAYRTAKAAARTAVFSGVSKDAFGRHYEPVLEAIRGDNRIGKAMFGVARAIQRKRFAQRAVVRMTAREQRREGRKRRMSGALWDLFTGSAGYKVMMLVRDEADVYVHKKGLKEWDTCAPETVARALGWSVCRLRGEEHRYNRPDPRNHELVVCRPAMNERVLAALSGSGALED